MDARFYNSDKIDIERLGNDLVNAYHAQGYQAQILTPNADQVVVQLKKGGDFEALIGMQAALTLTVQKRQGGTVAMIGQQRWVDKAAVGVASVVIPFLWPLAITAGAGAIRQASLGNQALNMVDGFILQQYPNVNVGPVPAYMMPDVQQNFSPPPQANPYYNPHQDPQPRPAEQNHFNQFSPFGGPPQQPPFAPQQQPGSGLRCTNCNTPYEPGDTFCTGCGRSLAEVKLYCSRCHYELKPGASFCPKCGESTFTTVAGAQQPVQPKNAPVAPTPTVSYVQRPETPKYTPPVKPETPYYVAPQNPVYTPPVQPTQPAQAYTPPPAKVTEPPAPAPYVPPKPGQQPPVLPQPKVTFSQPPKPATPPPPKAKQPPKVYYVPSNQAKSQSAEPNAQAPASTEQEQKAWGTLTLTNGTSFTLRGEHAVVGRAESDMSGLIPAVDLSQHENSDTVSRIHASIDFLNGAYSLVDLNSTNATRLNGKRLEPDKPATIKDGDELQFGKVVGKFSAS